MPGLFASLSSLSQVRLPGASHPLCASFLLRPRSPKATLPAGHRLQIQRIHREAATAARILGPWQPPPDSPGRSGVRACPLSTPSKTLQVNPPLGPRDHGSHLEEAAKEVHHTEHGAARALRPPAAPDRTAKLSSGRHPAPRPMVCPGPPRSPASTTRPRWARASPQGLVQTPVPPAH